MKCCLSSEQTMEYLSKADEIKVEYRHRKNIINLVEKYPEAHIVLDMSKYNGIIDWSEIKRYKILAKDKFYIGLNNLLDVDLCKENEIQFFWNFPVTSFWELRAMKDLGASYAYIEAPLTHDMENVAAIGLPIRFIPNIAYYAIVPRENGVCGSWVRPEDLALYEPYIDIIEFEDCDIKKEQALYRIYMEQHVWSGDLGLIITNLNYPGVNRMIPPELAEHRIKCQQKCMVDSKCKLCYRYLDLANPDILRPYKKDAIDN